LPAELVDGRECLSGFVPSVADGIAQGVCKVFHLGGTVIILNMQWRHKVAMLCCAVLKQIYIYFYDIAIFPGDNFRFTTLPAIFVSKKL